MTKKVETRARALSETLVAEYHGGNPEQTAEWFDAIMQTPRRVPVLWTELQGDLGPAAFAVQVLFDIVRKRMTVEVDGEPVRGYIPLTDSDFEWGAGWDYDRIYADAVELASGEVKA